MWLGVRAQIVGIVLATCLAPVAVGSEDPSLLLRIDRRSEGDLASLRKAGLPVVMETLQSLYLIGSAGDLQALTERGYIPSILDREADRSEYFMIGLRPDSNRELVARVGSVVHEEENLLLLRVAPGAPISLLLDARVFLSRVPHLPVAVPLEPPVVPPSRSATDGVPDPIVQRIVAAVSPTQIDDTWTDLTTNPPTGSRYSESQGCRDASAYCLSTFQSYGMPAEYQNYSAQQAPNVVGTHEGAVYPDRVYIIEGHLDDLPSSGPAPGADDNASGVVAVLEASRALSCYAFRNTVKFLAVTGEELGLYGSEYYADDAFARGEKIQGVLNFDMIGWAGDGIPNPENLDLNYNTTSQWLAQRFVDASTTYATGLVVDAFYCPSLSASDHYPFWQKGWSALCGITDNEGYCGHGGNYPYYHTSNDTIANCGNKSFFNSVVKTSVATLAELAEPFKVTFDRPAYACGIPLHIVVGDRDLNTSPSSQQTVAVDVWSTSEPTPETIVLTERGTNSMIFEGTVPTTSAPPTPGDGVITTVQGDTTHAEYVDAQDCDGTTNRVYEATAGTDCVGPMISGVGERDVTDVQATIVWTTDEPSDSLVRWGQTTPPAQTSSDPAIVSSHSVTLTGLQACTIYYYEVQSTDPPGNVALDDSGGRYHHFETYGNFGAGLQPCHEGRISLESSVVGCSDTLAVRLVDMDLNLSSTTIDTVTVTVTSSTETTPENVLLTETGANTSTFRGTIPTATGAPAPGDGILQVAAGDLLTATYRDANDGTGIPATSFATGDADCSGPAISDLRVTDVTDEAATIRWTTSEPSDGRVEWGPTPSLGSLASHADLTTTHALTLRPMTECGRAYFRVRSTDTHGNTTSRDVAGSPHGFNAFKIPGIFVEGFETPSGWTLEGEWQVDVPQGKGTSPGDPTQAFAGAKVLGHDLTGLGAHPGDYENGTSQRAASPVINASSLVHGKLLFRRWLNSGGGTANAYVEVKRGSTWFTVWTNPVMGVSESAWSLQSVDISTYADGNAALQVAFRQTGGLASAGTRAGWNVDRLVVKSADTPDYDACGGCGGAPTFAGLVSATDASGCADTGIHLSWAAAPAWGTGHAGRYAIYRSTDPSFVPAPSNLVASGIQATSYTDATAPNDVTLHYVVRAENDETCASGPANGGVVDGNLVRVAARDEIAQPAPGDVGGSLTAQGINHAHVRLAWSAASGAARYRVYRGSSPQGPFTPIAEVEASPHEDRDAMGSGVDGYYVVRAADACGNEGP